MNKALPWLGFYQVALAHWHLGLKDYSANLHPAAWALQTQLLMCLFNITRLHCRPTPRRMYTWHLWGDNIRCSFPLLICGCSVCTPCFRVRSVHQGQLHPCAALSCSKRLFFCVNSTLAINIVVGELCKIPLRFHSRAIIELPWWRVSPWQKHGIRHRHWFATKF